MGNYNIRKLKRIKDTKESWEYEGIIYQINDDIYNINYKLSGNIYIKEVNKKEIQIQGIINNFELIGKKKSNNIFQNIETISFGIINEKDI
jgi:sporulation-control protein spo0M